MIREHERRKDVLLRHDKLNFTIVHREGRHSHSVARAELVARLPLVPGTTPGPKRDATDGIFKWRDYSAALNIHEAQ